MKNFFITLGMVLLVIAVVVGGGYFAFRHVVHTHTYRPLDGDATMADAVVFEIAPGMLAADVAEELYEAGLIRNAMVASQIVRFNDWGVIQAGEYEIHSGMSLYEMFGVFIEGNYVELEWVYVVIPEGARLDWIALLFADALDMEASVLLDVWSDEAFLEALIDEYWFLTDEILDPVILYPLEGYFYPIRHEIPADVTDPYDVTRVMLDMTARMLLPQRTEIESNEMTFHEILAFAAIIEAETQDPNEKETVAGVFQNRLDIGMLLQTDVTVQYIAPERSFHVDAEMLAIASPFNTYLYLGLPPGPVNSPSRGAIAAAMNPEAHNYYFFISDMFGCVGDPGNKNYFTDFADHYAFYLEHLRPSYDAGRSLCNEDVQVN